MHTLYVKPPGPAIEQTGILEEREIFALRHSRARRFAHKRKIVRMGFHKFRGKSLGRLARTLLTRDKRGIEETRAPCQRPSLLPMTSDLRVGAGKSCAPRF